MKELTTYNRIINKLPLHKIRVQFGYTKGPNPLL